MDSRILFFFVAPSSISRLEIVPTTMDKIAFKWGPPEKSNGKILNYTVEIQVDRTFSMENIKLIRK